MTTAELTRQRLTAEQEAMIIGLASAGLTHERIAEQLGVARRTVSHAVARLRETPQGQAIVLATQQAMAGRLWQVFDDAVAGSSEAVAAQRAILADERAKPVEKSRAGEVIARLIDVLGNRHALLSGLATSRAGRAFDEFGAELSDDERRVLVSAAQEYLAASGPAALPVSSGGAAQLGPPVAMDADQAQPIALPAETPEPEADDAEPLDEAAALRILAVAARIEAASDEQLEQQAPALVAELDEVGAHVPDWLRQAAEAGR